jgi:syntaxin 5
MGFLALQDRTEELRSVARLFERDSAAGTSGATAAARPGDAGAAAPQTSFTPERTAELAVKHSPGWQRSNFAVCAAQIGGRIHETSAKLAQLTRLARQRSLFDDHSEEIDRLTSQIKSDIGYINHQLDELQQLARRTADPGSNGERRTGDKRTDATTTTTGSNALAQQHTRIIVDSLRARLLNATQTFQSVLQERSATLRVRPEHKAATQKLPSVSHSIFDLKPNELERGSSFLDLGSGSLGASQQQQQQQQQLWYQPQEQQLVHAPPAASLRYYQQRTDAVQRVEATIVELGQIFHQLSRMVAEQGELVQRIDVNIEDSLAHVEGAHGQLLRYFESLRSNRGLILKLFGVLSLFIVLWVLIL